jgi:hypothetical protein
MTKFFLVFFFSDRERHFSSLNCRASCAGMRLRLRDKPLARICVVHLRYVQQRVDKQQVPRLNENCSAIPPMQNFFQVARFSNCTRRDLPVAGECASTGAAFGEIAPGTSFPSAWEDLYATAAVRERGRRPCGASEWRESSEFFILNVCPILAKSSSRSSTQQCRSALFSLTVAVVPRRTVSVPV